MGTELIEKDWTASKKCTVTLRKDSVVVYIRYNNHQEGTLQIGQMVTLEKGDRIVSLLEYTIEVEDVGR